MRIEKCWVLLLWLYLEKHRTAEMVTQMTKECGKAVLLCIGDLHVTVTRIPDRNNVKEGMLYSGSCFQSRILGKTC